MSNTFYLRFSFVQTKHLSMAFFNVDSFNFVDCSNSAILDNYPSGDTIEDGFMATFAATLGIC